MLLLGSRSGVVSARDSDFYRLLSALMGHRGRRRFSRDYLPPVASLIGYKEMYSSLCPEPQGKAYDMFK